MKHEKKREKKTKQKERKGKKKKKTKRKEKRKRRKHTYLPTWTWPEILCPAGSARSLVHACRPRCRASAHRAGAVRPMAFVRSFGPEESRQVPRYVN